VVFGGARFKCVSINKQAQEEHLVGSPAAEFFFEFASRKAIAIVASSKHVILYHRE